MDRIRLNVGFAPGSGHIAAGRAMAEGIMSCGFVTRATWASIDRRVPVDCRALSRRRLTPLGELGPMAVFVVRPICCRSI
jgi:hypothetical protein